MPILINLLAEVQATEEQRRKDPVKRAIWIASGVVLLVVVWIGYLQLQIMRLDNQVSLLDGEWARLKPKYDAVQANSGKIGDTDKKVHALQQLSVARFLWGPVLNSLGQSMTNGSNVQVIRLATEQSFVAPPPAAKPPPGVLPKPVATVEKVKLTLTAKDYGKDTDENYNKMREAIASFPYFKETLDKSKGISLQSLSPRSVDPVDPSRSFVQFVLECQFAEKNHLLK
jgi:hypothetical protein